MAIGQRRAHDSLLSVSLALQLTDQQSYKQHGTLTEKNKVAKATLTNSCDIDKEAQSSLIVMGKSDIRWGKEGDVAILSTA